ncbi:uncharacterized protein [Battus philenor]|uniref:uncharacterized protein n=1 Tax=Battus philenor TaxID=42288 RepID=UPI0035D06F19
MQMLSGYGCFGKYLCRISTELSTICHYFGSEEDTDQHTLEEYTAWDELRRELTDTEGNVLLLPGFVKVMVQNGPSWSAGITLKVMSQKEAADRERERTSELSIRRRRPGRQRVLYRAFLQPPYHGLGDGVRMICRK